MFFEGFQERDLSESWGGDALFFSFELDVFDCNESVVFVDSFVDLPEGTLSDDTHLGKSINFFHYLKNYIV